jgi:hypothetical protein
MGLMGATERKLKCLELAVRIQRRVTREDPMPSAEDVLAMAKTFDEWVYPPIEGRP